MTRGWWASGGELFDRVTAYLRPTAGMAAWTTQYPRKPLTERRTLAAHAATAVDLVRRHRADEETVRCATFIAQVATLFADDLDDDTALLKAARPLGRGSNEYTLDRARYRDYLLDMRTVAEPARAWLRGSRPTRDIGTDCPEDPRPIALGTFHDVLIHLHEVRAAALRPCAAPNAPSSPAGDVGADS